MFRKFLAVTTALSLMVTTARSQELPLPLNRVWKGVVECADGFRSFGLLAVDARPRPLYVVMLGPRKQDGPNGRGGLLLAESVYDPRGFHLNISRVLGATSSVPTMVGGHVQAKDGRIYGGVDGVSDCRYMEALEAHDPDAEAHLKMATSNPQAYLDGLNRQLHAPPPRGTTAEDWFGLAFAGLVIAGIVAATGGAFGTPTGKVATPGGGFGSPDTEDGGSAPSVGGNAHGNGPSDIQGNPWNGTGSGPALGQDVHGN